MCQNNVYTPIMFQNLKNRLVTMHGGYPLILLICTLLIKFIWKELKELLTYFNSDGSVHYINKTAMG